MSSSTGRKGVERASRRELPPTPSSSTSTSTSTSTPLQQQTQAQTQAQAQAQAQGGKILLPRPHEGWPRPTGPRKRTTHACDRCRVMKIKCSGGLRCTKCAADNQVCVYGDGKRERNKKGLVESLQRNESLAEQNRSLLIALQNLAADPRLQLDDHPTVLELLARYPTERLQEGSHVSGSADADSGTEMAIESGGGGETQAPARVGSPGTQDQLSTIVDLDSGAGAAGFIGKLSEVSWMQRARELLLRRIHPALIARNVDEPSPGSQDLIYHMDDTNLLSFEEDRVDPLHVPPPDVAVILSEAYFETMYSTFPFINREDFLDALDHFPRNKSSLSWGERRWLSTANIVFALGSKWLYLSAAEGQVRADDHLIFYARARALGLDHRLLFDHPMFEQVQALGMLASYLFANNSITRAWTVLGHAIRHSTSMGLHLRVVAPSMTTHQKIVRARTWYSLYNLEMALGQITGRPTSISLSDISVPLGLVEDMYMTKDIPAGSIASHEPASSSQPRGKQLPRSTEDPHTAYFACRTSLSEISHKIAAALYGPASDSITWAMVQQKIRQFDLDLQQWHVDLPPELNVVEQQPVNRFFRLSVELALYYSSLRMLLFRPCLCDMDGRIENESRASKTFNRMAALACIDAATSTLALMPTNPQSSEAFNLLPWWSVLHYLCQAGAVLVMELALAAQHTPSQGEELVDKLKKVMAYLRHLASDSLSAYKAWRLFRGLFTEAAAMYEADISDVPLDAPQPLDWTTTHEMSIARALDGLGRSSHVQSPSAMGSTDHATFLDGHPAGMGENVGMDEPVTSPWSEFYSGTWSWEGFR